MKKLLFPALLLLCGSCLGGVNPRLDSLSSAVLKLSSLPSTGTSQTGLTAVYNAVNRAITETCKHYPAIESVDTVTVDSLTQWMTLNTNFDRAFSVELIFDDTATIALIPLDPETRSTLMGRGRYKTKEPSEISHYETFNDKIQILPQYGRGDSGTLVVRYFAVDSNLTVASSQTTVAEQYRLFVVYHAVAEIAESRGLYEIGAYYRSLFTGSTRDTEGKK